MLDVGTVETPEDVFCFCGPEPEGRGVLDQLIWLTAAGITSGRLFRPVTRHGTVRKRGIEDEKVIWKLVLKYARQTKLGKLAPHDLRRTCAKFCRKAGGDLEQIQILLGHSSIQTTERYLGTEQALSRAVNDT